MHTIEPYYKWIDQYVASDDPDSPFYGRVYNEFSYTNKIYNYFIHPQWDEIGSQTLYLKVLFVDYDQKYAIIELIGEWNDCLHNDVMFLKRELIDHLTEKDIRHFILICDNVLNFHAGDDCYYEEWSEDIQDWGGWITMINLFEHVQDEMQDIGIQHFVNLGPQFNDMAWRGKKPQHVHEEVLNRINSSVKQLKY